MPDDIGTPISIGHYEGSDGVAKVHVNTLSSICETICQEHPENPRVSGV
jgi:hypothetical protein